jgi:GTPase SAR1 family protein
MALKQQKEINILLLGETGVGKSTFINAFANYLTYETMEEAEKGELISLIPTEFTVTDADYQERRVKIGDDINEINKIGQSATQQCKAYCFTYGNILVRLIDTPGVGDTRGIEQDKMNFANLLSFIGEYDEIHLICILLKPNNSRITVTFEFCVKQLLCHLQKSASKNMIFLFTNARSTFYRPGDTSTSLREILKEIQSRPPFVEIPFKKETIYCLDNEAFRFLVALYNGIKFEDDERNNFSQSWSKSVTKCSRLVNYIIEGTDGLGLPPHKVKDTISVNEARRLIVGLSQPIADIANNIEANLKVLSQHEREISNYDGTIEGLKSMLYIPELEIGVTKPHNPFNIFGWVTHGINVVGHYLTYYNSYAVEQRKRMTAELKTKEDAKKAIESLVKTLQETSKSYTEEKDTITKASAKFAVFLKNNAIAPYNDTFKDYLEHLIENQKTKSKDESIIKENINGLQKIIDEYEKEKKILEDAIDLGNKESCDVSAKQIIDIINELYHLKIAGQKIKELHDLQQGGRVADNQQREIVHNVSNKKTGMFGKLTQLLKLSK